MLHHRNPVGVGGKDGTACPGVQGTPGSKSAAPLGQTKHLWLSLVVHHNHSHPERYRVTGAIVTFRQPAEAETPAGVTLT